MITVQKRGKSMLKAFSDLMPLLVYFSAVFVWCCISPIPLILYPITSVSIRLYFNILLASYLYLCTDVLHLQYIRGDCCTHNVKSYHRRRYKSFRESSRVFSSISINSQLFQ